MMPQMQHHQGMYPPPSQSGYPGQYGMMHGGMLGGDPGKGM